MSQALPHDDGCERAVLAAVLLRNNILDDVSTIIGPEDFYFDRHRLIFESQLRLAHASKSIDLRTLQADLQANIDLAYLAGLDLALPDIGRAREYATIVKERSVRRRLILALGEVITGCRGAVSAADSLAAAENVLQEIGGLSVSTDLRGLEHIHQDTIDWMVEHSSGGLIGLPTGFTKFDAWTRGLCPGQLVVVAGRPGMGKTSFMVDVARHAAFRAGRVVGIFSMEMTDVELNHRIIAAETGLDLMTIRSGRLTQRQWNEVYAAMRATQDTGLFIDQAPDPTFSEIAAKARRLRARVGRLDLLCVDYLQLMTTDQPQYRREMLEQLTRSLKRLARQLEVPVMMLSQLSRKPDDRPDHRPRISDLRETGAIEQDADLIAFPYRDEIYDPDESLRGKAELIIGKHRNGPLGTLDLYFRAPQSSFCNPTDAPEAW